MLLHNAFRDAAFIEFDDGSHFHLYENWLKASFRLVAPAANYLANQYRKESRSFLLTLRIEAHSENNQCLNQLHKLYLDSGTSGRESDNQMKPPTTSFNLKQGVKLTLKCLSSQRVQMCQI